MSAAGLLSRSATRVVATAANGFHLLRIDGYSQAAKTVLPGQMISSQPFNIGGRSWRIDYYPNGRDTSANANSVYLRLTDPTQRLLLLQAEYKFGLLDHDGNAAYELPAETGSFAGAPNTHYSRPSSYGLVPAAGEEAGPGCGHEEFIGKEELERRREDLIRDDRVVVRCDVGVTQFDRSYLALDELCEDQEESDVRYHGYAGYGHGGYGPPPRRLLQRRTDDAEYVKWCLTQQAGGSSRGHLHGRPGGYGFGGEGC
uniref:Uncharacterized protein n=1 Tax=Avena sativa TaxID=4498 RepID=A0ACD5W3S9_AVESA